MDLGSLVPIILNLFKQDDSINKTDEQKNSSPDFSNEMWQLPNYNNIQSSKQNTNQNSFNEQNVNEPKTNFPSNNLDIENIINIAGELLKLFPKNNITKKEEITSSYISSLPKIDSTDF